jgi:lipopolysaccharide biosynthesis protein
MTFEPSVRLIAFYLPQFHPIPENDKWWGKGFTEWTNVAKAKPLFKSHYQPHLPADLGFYDLRLPEVREAQADLARKYGIYGFCYYHYWFNGRRILERPFQEVLDSGKPDFPFCLCWANENWTRVWDGGNKHILLEQNYSIEDDIAHIKNLIPAFKDRRYIKIDGKPLFLVYRSELLPNPARTTEIWQKEALNAGFDGLYLTRVESFTDEIDPRVIGFNAATEFAPDWRNKGKLKKRGRLYRLLTRLGTVSEAYSNNWVIEYDSLIKQMLKKGKKDYIRFRCVTPSWDNSPRRNGGAIIFTGSTPEKYENWLRDVISKAKGKSRMQNSFVFINAWNEWGESNHLEPDQKWGHAYLEATYRAING